MVETLSRPRHSNAIAARSSLRDRPYDRAVTVRPNVRGTVREIPHAGGRRDQLDLHDTRVGIAIGDRDEIERRRIRVTLSASAALADDIDIPQTTAEHEALAKQYRDQAAQYKNVADDHRAMTAAYKKSIEKLSELARFVGR